MSTVKSDFDSRVAEIEEYLAFISGMESGEMLLVRKATDAPFYSSSTRDDLLRTHRACAILLLYNLMESTVTNAVESIFDELYAKGVHFNDCRSEVRRVVLTNLKQHNPGEILPVLQQLSTDIIIKTFKKDKIVSGNVDARRIRELSDEYGIDRPTADGDDLLTVKTSRNDLAHGSKSFSEVGRTYAVSDIIRMKDKVIAYLTSMIANVAEYVDRGRYRASTSNP